MEDTNISKSSRYKITLPSDITDQLLKDLGIMSLDSEGMLEIDNGIADFVVMDECCKRNYIKGAFVSCATSNIIIKNYDNDKVNSGYHLEFVFNFEKIAEDFVRLLEYFEIPAKITIRKNAPIVYIKEYQLICDTLALVGANKAVLDLQNEAAIRELRNNVNRQTNCMNANLNKTVNASIKQLNAIKIIQENMGLESLSESLMELALLRLANPESSLEELRMLFSQPLTKSGINHRFAKIIKIAEDITKSKFTITTL
jgi:DNA-binding protein WhiA